MFSSYNPKFLRQCRCLVMCDNEKYRKICIEDIQREIYEKFFQEEVHYDRRVEKFPFDFSRFFLNVWRQISLCSRENFWSSKKISSATRYETSTIRLTFSTFDWWTVRHLLFDFNTYKRVSVDLLYRIRFFWLSSSYQTKNMKKYEIFYLYVC